MRSEAKTSVAYRWEFKENHEEWLNTANPDLGPGIAARAQAALETSGELVTLVQQIRNEARFVINDLLKVSFLIGDWLLAALSLPSKGLSDD